MASQLAAGGARTLLQLGGLNYDLQSPVVMFLLAIGCVTMGLPALAYFVWKAKELYFRFTNWVSKKKRKKALAEQRMALEAAGEMGAEEIAAAMAIDDEDDGSMSDWDVEEAIGELIPHAPWRAAEGLEGDRERARRARRRAREKLSRMYFWQRCGRKAKSLREQAKTPKHGEGEGEGEEAESHKGAAGEDEDSDEERRHQTRHGMRQQSRNLADAILRKVHRSVAEAIEPLHHLDSDVLDLDPDDPAASGGGGGAAAWISKRLSVKRGSIALAAREAREEKGKTPDTASGYESEAAPGKGARKQRGKTPDSAAGDESESPAPGKVSRKQKPRMETPL